MLRVPPKWPRLLRPPRARYFQKVIGEIVDALPCENPFPATLTLQEQGLFAVGYYHQRQALFTKKTRTDTSAPTANAQ